MSNCRYYSVSRAWANWQEVFCFILRWCFSEIKYIKPFNSGKCLAHICWDTQSSVVNNSIYLVLHCTTFYSEARKLAACALRALIELNWSPPGSFLQFYISKKLLGAKLRLDFALTWLETIFGYKGGRKKKL